MFDEKFFPFNGDIPVTNDTNLSLSYFKEAGAPLPTQSKLTDPPIHTHDNTSPRPCYLCHGEYVRKPTSATSTTVDMSSVNYEPISLASTGQESPSSAV